CQAAILVEKDANQRDHDRFGLRRLFGGESECVSEAASLEWLQARVRIDSSLQDLFGAADRDLFDFDAAFGAGHQHRQANGAVDDHADVNFAGNIGGFLHQDLADLLTRFTSLLGDQRVLEHDLGDGADVVALGEILDPTPIFAAVFEAPLAAAAGVYLRLEND